MATQKIDSQKAKEALASLIRKLPGILAGSLPDVDDIAKGFQSRLAWQFTSLVREDFVIKARGGTGAGGIKWKPLSISYLMGQRRSSIQKLKPGVVRKKKTTAKLKQKLEYTKIYREAFGREVARNPVGKAKKIAKAYAEAHTRGVPTQREMMMTIARGLRPGVDYEILRDTGRLLNSLSPGILVESGGTAHYNPPDDQIVNAAPGVIMVGTNMEYASKHHNGEGNVPARPFWPKNLPPDWMRQIREAATTGLRRIGLKIAK